MGIDWSHLPKEVIKVVCMCPMANGFRRDPDTEYWVHAKCGKPTIPVAVRQCDSCFTTFVPKNYKPSEKVVECEQCRPTNTVRRGKLNF